MASFHLLLATTLAGNSERGTGGHFCARALRSRNHLSLPGRSAWCILLRTCTKKSDLACAVCEYERIREACAHLSSAHGRDLLA